MTSQSIQVLEVFREAFLLAKERYQRDFKENPDEKDISPHKCIIGWGMLFCILNMEECNFKITVMKHHTAFQARLEVSSDCPDMGVYFIYE